MLDKQVPRAPRSGAAEVSNGSGSNANEEVELKLLAPAGALEQLREASIIARRACNGGVSRRLESVYYDTADRNLFSHGMSLRVRRDGKRYVQTLKRGSVDGQPFVRGEWETAVDSFAPDLALLPVSEIGAPLDNIMPAALDEIFVTKVRRRTQRLDFFGAVVEVAFDEGSIEAGERHEPLSEIELELKSGAPSVLYDLGVELLDIAPVRIGTRSKAERGYDLAFGVALKATKASVPAISIEHTVDDIISILLATCQNHLLANQAVAESGGDPEGVHQMRVALRRMRTACALLHRELCSPTLQAFNAEGKWLADLLGAVRDWDVLISETLNGPLEALRSDILDFDGLRQAAEPHRLAAYAPLREALASQRYNRFQLSLRHWIELRGWRNELRNRSLAALLEPAPRFAGRVLTRLHRNALKRGAHFRHLQPEARHDLRIALKKLRYATEFFQRLLGGNDKAQDYVGCLAHLQDALGHDNDASMAWPFLDALARDPVAPDVQRTIGVVMGWQARDRIAVGKALPKLWRQFRTVPTPWPKLTDPGF